MVTISKELAKVIEKNKHWIIEDSEGFSLWLHEENRNLWSSLLSRQSLELDVFARATYLNAKGGFVSGFCKALAVHGYEVEEENKNSLTVEIEAKIKGFMACPHCGSHSVQEAGEITIKCNDCSETFIPLIK